MKKNNSNNDQLYLIDGSGFIFRSFYAIPPMSRPDGTPVNAVFGFTSMLLKILEDLKPNYIAVVFDVSRKTFRKDIYPDYKINRTDIPTELIPQLPLIREVCNAFNVTVIEKEGFEADDLIATYAYLALNKGMKSLIISSDKDLMQLISDNIEMLDPIKNRKISKDEVIEKFGVLPEKVKEVQAIAGDSTDNIPGVPGIGIKTASELINRFGDLRGILKNVNEITQPKRRQSIIDNLENIKISYELVTLKKDVPVIFKLSNLKFKKPKLKKLLNFLESQNFSSIISRINHKKLFLENETTKKITNYQIINKTSDLRSWIFDAKKAGRVGMKVFTASINSMIAELIGVAFSITPYKACYVPINTNNTVQDNFLINIKSKEDFSPIDIKEFLSIIKPLLTDKSIVKISQNIKHDQLVFSNYGISINPIDDIMILSYILDGTKHKHNITELSKIYLDCDIENYKTFIEKKLISDLDINILSNYAVQYVDFIGRIYDILKCRLVNESMSSVYETIDRPLINVLVSMEKMGVAIKIDKLKELKEKFTSMLNILEKEIYKLAGCNFNIASAKQLSKILFDDMGFKYEKKNKTGFYSTSADILDKLAKQGHEFPSKILEWRLISKLKSTYVDALLAQINPITNRIHTSFSMVTASTGRLSSSNPNLQNIPIRSDEGKDIRCAFIPKKDYKILSLDYSQIELRLLAHFADVDKLKEAFINKLDVHKHTASQVFKVPFELIDKNLRYKAKAINFGIIYGISAFGLSQQLNIPRNDAANYIESYLEYYSGINGHMKKVKEFAAKHGFVETIYGRRCYILGINSKNSLQRNFAERQAINAPIQGSAADIIKKAMICIDNLLIQKKLKTKMVLQVHDELIFEVPKEEINEVINLTKNSMEQIIKLDVPLIVDVGIGDNWNEAH